MNITTKIPASFIRGGTSKGLFFNETNLPSAGEERDKLLLAIMGSPDPTGMQLNGMGGGISSTSKVVLISKSQRPNSDINYLFGQVSLTEAKIDWQGSCGNLAAAVGLYAINEKMVQLDKNGFARIKVWQANLGYEIHLEIPSYNENNLIAIPGVPGNGRPIYVEFIDPSSGNSLIPGGEPVHEIELPNGKKIQASLIRGANPTIFVRASDLGLSGKELPNEIDFESLNNVIKTISIQGAAIMQVPYTAAVRVAWVAPSADNEISLLSRISTEGRVHHAYTGTGAINLACAAKIPGTIPFQIIAEVSSNKNPDATVNIGHPKGVMQVKAKVTFDDSSKKWLALSAGFIRTAKILMVGEVYA